jgi:hypothetical protein
VSHMAAVVAQAPLLPLPSFKTWPIVTDHRCLRGLGTNHSNFAEFLVAPLLGFVSAAIQVDCRTDFHFAQVEMSRDDPFYVCLVAFLSAAACVRPSIIALLPDFLLRHLR